MSDPYEALRDFFPNFELPSSSRQITSLPPPRVLTRPKRPKAPRKRRKHLFNNPHFNNGQSFHRSNFLITSFDKNIQISCMVTLKTDADSLTSVLPAALSSIQDDLLAKLQEKHPNRQTRLLCVRVDHPQLTANHEMFVHLRPSTNLGSHILQQVNRCLISDRKVNFEDSFKIVLFAQFT